MSLRKNETLTSWPLSQHICPHFWAWLLNTIAITPKSEDKYVVKVVNWSEFHFSEVTFFQNWYFNIIFFPGVFDMYFDFYPNIPCHFEGTSWKWYYTLKPNYFKKPSFFIIIFLKVKIFLEQREVAFLSPCKICENLSFSTEIQIFANFAGW